MTGFDFAVAGILLVSLLLGLWRGFVYEVLALLGWPLAFVLSKMFASYAEPLMTLLPFKQETSRMTASYVLVFVWVLIVWSVLARLLSKLFKMIGVGWTDRALGGLFGVLRGALLVLVMVWLVGLTQVTEQSFWRNAVTRKPLEDVALLTKVWLPDAVRQRIHYGTRG